MGVQHAAASWSAVWIAAWMTKAATLTLCGVSSSLSPLVLIFTRVEAVISSNSRP
jgi:hypothetical protein